MENNKKIENILGGEDVESGKNNPQVARVSIKARKWLTSKMYPKFFSDRVHHQHDMTVDVRKQHVEELRKLSRKGNSLLNPIVVSEIFCCVDL